MKKNNSLYYAIIGGIVGDAFGVPYEFLSKANVKKIITSKMIGNGTHNKKIGTWSDDTSMTLCLLDSIADCKELNLKDIMDKFALWKDKDFYTVDGLFDIGNSCSQAIETWQNGHTSPENCGGKQEYDNGNGSLMRILPLVFYLRKNNFVDNGMISRQGLDCIHSVSSLTHGHICSLVGCDIMCNLFNMILDGKSKDYIKNHILDFTKIYTQEEKNALHKYYDFIVNADIFNLKNDENVTGSGYIVDTIKTVLYAFYNTNNYKDCIITAVMQGVDTDTTASIAGTIAGAFYKDIPNEWIENVRSKDFIYSIIEKFEKVV